MKNKKMYQSPSLFDLNSTEAIGSCNLGVEVTNCTTGGIYRTGECQTGNGVKPINCVNGGDAWQKH